MNASNIIALVAAAGAILAASFAGWQAHATSSQVTLDANIRKEQASPQVSVDVRPDESGFLMKLVVENLGPTVARNVRIKFDPPLKSASFADRVEGLKIFTDGIPSLPPGRQIRWLFDTGPAIFNNDVPKQYRVTIDSEGPFGPVPTLVYDLDFAILYNSDATATATLKDISKAIADNTKSLDKITAKLERLAGLHEKRATVLAGVASSAMRRRASRTR
jgi:hypothetical protein